LDASQTSTACLLQLAQKLLDFRGGRLLFPERHDPGLSEVSGDDQGDDDHWTPHEDAVGEMLDLVGRVLDSEGKGAAAHNGPVASAAVRVLCSAWVAVEAAPSQRHKRNQDGARISNLLRKALRPRIRPGGSDELIEAPGSVASVLFLSEHVIRYLLERAPDGEAAMSSVGSILISTAAALLLAPFSAKTEARRIVYSVVLATDRVRRQTTSSLHQEEDSDRCFDLSLARHVSVTASERDRLLRCFLAEILGDSPRTSLSSSAKGNELAERVLSATFCAGVATTDEESTKPEEQDPSSNADACLDCLLQFGESMQQRIQDSDTSPGSKGNSAACGRNVLLSLTLECASAVASQSLARVNEASIHSSQRQTVSRLQRLTERHLLASPSSLLTVKSAAAAVQMLSSVDQKISDDADAIFDALVPNLCCKNHFLRLRSIQILLSLPPKPYVTDHATLDLSDDLDEEPSGYLDDQEQKDRSGSGTLQGMSEVLKLLWRVESTALSLREERSLLSQIGRVGVLGKTGRLPVAHAEAAASHLLGIFHSKFAPIWPAAVQALSALAKGHEDCVWPWIHKVLVALTDSYDEQGVEPGSAAPDTSDQTLYDLCVAWEENGHPQLFRADLERAKENGVVSRHDSTDLLTVFESSWAVLEKAPWLMTKHSKSLVELFLRFMHDHYYTGKLEDPDARELNLAMHLGGVSDRYVKHHSWELL
jgi:hypothetical protein